MMMVFSWLDDTLIFAEDEQYVKLSNNQRTLYMYQKWEEATTSTTCRIPIGSISSSRAGAQ